MGEVSRRRWAVIASLVFVMPAGSLHAQQAGPPASTGGDLAGPTRVKAMAEHAGSIRVSAPEEVALIPEPILRYDDKPRNIYDATLWAWGPKGRPAAVLKVENYPHRPAQLRWLYGI